MTQSAKDTLHDTLPPRSYTFFDFGCAAVVVVVVGVAVGISTSSCPDQRYNNIHITQVGRAGAVRR
jgi:hypothetical protein